MGFYEIWYWRVLVKLVDIPVFVKSDKNNGTLYTEHFCAYLQHNSLNIERRYPYSSELVYSTVRNGLPANPKITESLVLGIIKQSLLPPDFIGLYVN
jgi:hypothetical protein